MSIAQRRLEEKEKRRHEIIDAAEVVFTGSGFERATMAEIAEAARLSRGLLYVYFEDKDDLYLAVTLRGMELLHDRFREAAEAEESGLNKFGAIGRTYVRFANDQPLYFEALARFEVREVQPEDVTGYEAMCLEVGRKINEMMAGAVAAGVEDGSIRGDVGDPMTVAVTLWGFTHGMIQLLKVKASMLEQLYEIGRSRLLNHAFQLMVRSIAAIPFVEVEVQQ